ncbi:MAG: Fic family protein [Myxococcota bacterium]
MLDNNIGSGVLSPGQQEMIDENLLELESIAEIEQALLLFQPGGEEAFRSASSLNAETLRKAHKQMFARVFPWGGEYRSESVEVGRENYPTPDPGWLLDHLTELDELMKRVCSSDELAQTSASDARLWYAAARIYFEICVVHPFKDGNGRVSRLAVECFLRSVLQDDLPLLWNDISRVGAKTRWAFRRARDENYLAPLATLLFKAFRKAKFSKNGEVIDCPDRLRSDLCGTL